jgi:hypothetical protein
MPTELTLYALGGAREAYSASTCQSATIFIQGEEVRPALFERHMIQDGAHESDLTRLPCIELTGNQARESVAKRKPMASRGCRIC